MRPFTKAQLKGAIFIVQKETRSEFFREIIKLFLAKYPEHTIEELVVCETKRPDGITTEYWLDFKDNLTPPGTPARVDSKGKL